MPGNPPPAEGAGHSGARVALLAQAAAAAGDYAEAAKAVLRRQIAPDGQMDRDRLDAHQHNAHGLAWIATYGAVLHESAAWAARLEADGRFGPLEAGLSGILFGEYLAQLLGGLPMWGNEFIRPRDLGLEEAAARLALAPAVAHFLCEGPSQHSKAALAPLLREALGRATAEDTGLEPEYAQIRDQFHRFSEEQIVPHAHGWHLRDELIPLPVIQAMADLGVFGLTIPEAYGGLGLSKLAMCVVSEELSRGYIGVGSLGTRSEIAAELILAGGVESQMQEFLPALARGEILPTAVFTEPNTGSDLGSLRTRAARKGEDYLITGAKTWITHGARADLMTLLARTDADSEDYRGLSMFLARKPRGSMEAPFPAPGMQGGEIAVLGYRGMKEYEISFDGFCVPGANLLGHREGEGFKQLMATFESARIQTAARAVGVGQSAFELGLRYALERKQFGQQIYAFPRVYHKLLLAAAELLGARQLTYFAARQKDTGKRCDLEAGMAKLLAARVAWTHADAALQIHGGNGFALEYPISRVLCDARILNIFEGAGEIQAQVIARRLLEG